MAKHRALIVGAGRMGAGYGWGPWPYVYTHADAYLALRERVELVGFVEPDEERAQKAGAKYQLPWWPKLEDAIQYGRPDIVSVCTQPSTTPQILLELAKTDVKGIWVEKPVTSDPDAFKAILEPLSSKAVQVNYIRRFDARHYRRTDWNGPNSTELWVWGKKDEHTVCHFADLARFWEIPLDRIHYFEMDGPCSYIVTGIYEPDEFFPLGGVQGGFMENALGNLLNTVCGKDKLICPLEEAYKTCLFTKELEASWKKSP